SLLTFVDCLLSDEEFLEWFAAAPLASLVSYGMTGEEIEDVGDVLASETVRSSLAQALVPFVEAIRETMARSEQPWDTAQSRLIALQLELARTRDRIALARRSTQPIWARIWTRLTSFTSTIS